MIRPARGLGSIRRALVSVAVCQGNAASDRRDSMAAEYGPCMGTPTKPASELVWAISPPRHRRTSGADHESRLAAGQFERDLALMTADDLLTGILAGVRYQQASGALVQWHTETVVGQGIALVASMRDGAPDPGVERFMVDEAFSSVVAVARDAIGPDLRPREVRVRHQSDVRSPAELTVYEEAFGVAPAFERDANRLVFGA